MYECLHYINERYKPKPSDLICEYYVEPNRISLEKVSEHLAAESSIGTWTTISTMNPDIAKRLKPTVYSINKHTNEVKIAYPSDLFEPGNMPQILSSIAGNIYGMKAVRKLRLQDIKFPKKIVKKFKGPRLGIKGLRKFTGIKKRPFIGTIVKPKVGLTAKQHAKVAYDAWIGGCDLVKDDENLSSLNFNKFRDRVDYTLRAKEKAELKTGEKKLYLPNITAECVEMLKRGEYVKNQNGNYVMVDIVTTGYSALTTVRNKINLPIHIHRAGHAMFTRDPKHGMSMLTLAKISRLLGADTLHIGTAYVGKMVETKTDTLVIEDEIEHNMIQENVRAHVLEQKWYHIKPTFAVASGGLHPGMIPKLVDLMGKNIVMQFGGGIHGHPKGTVSGAMAAKQALNAVLKRKSLHDYAKTHNELSLAIKKWGVVK
ncbi:MAG: type III ribulose-bisphosphate carboxylase [archaeon]